MPHRSTMPSVTVTLTRLGRTHGSDLSRAITVSRSSLSAGDCGCVAFARNGALDEIRAADYPDDLAIVDNRYTLDPMTFKQSRNIGDGCVRPRRNDSARHDVTNSATVFLQVFRSKEFAAYQQFQPP
jgi:hypothetical protein